VKFDNKNILVIGDIMLDVYQYGEMTRISPEAPVPIVKIFKTKSRPGGAANVAMNLSALGCNTTLLGYIGRDEYGEVLVSKLREHDIRTYDLIQTESPTISKTRIMSGDQHILRYDQDSDFTNTNHKIINELQLIAKIVQQQKIDIVIVSDYAKGTITKDVMDAIQQTGCTMICDIKPKNKHLFNKVDMIVPNLTEAMEIANMPQSSGNLKSIAKKIISELHLRHIVITLSDHGIFAMDTHGKCMRVSAKNYGQVIDVVGAGDTVISVLAACASIDFDLFTATRLANIAAGIVVAKPGTSTCSVEELLDASI